MDSAATVLSSLSLEHSITSVRTTRTVLRMRSGVSEEHHLWMTQRVVRARF
jgi:hypothetical protein